MCTKSYSQPFLNKLQSCESEQEGLPNIGNTCFLNSAIQALYSVGQFRSKILSSKQQAKSIQYYLRKVFQSMKCKLSQKEKLQDLIKLQKYLIYLIKNYNGASQQDCAIFLHKIIDQLIAEDQTYRQYFYFSVTYQCSNNKLHMKWSENNLKMITSFKNICPVQGCQSQVEFYFTKIPKALIALDVSQNQQCLQLKILKGQNIYQYKFNLSAQILYQGNKQSGHYTCVRLTNSHKYRLYNDFKVSKQEQLVNFDFKSKKKLILLYQIQNDHDISIQKNPNFIIKKQLAPNISSSTQNNQISIFGRIYNYFLGDCLQRKNNQALAQL